MNTQSNRLSAVVLAAGQSKRFGLENKLLHEVDGVPLLRRVLRCFEEVGLKEVWVVLGYESEEVSRVLIGTAAKTVVNSRFEEGMGTSLACGVGALGTEDIEGFLLCLGDLPHLTGRHVEKVVEAFCSEGGHKIIVPVFEDTRGHPVCLPARYRTDLARLSGDEGAKRLIERNSSVVRFLPMPDSGCIQDLDSL